MKISRQQLERLLNKSLATLGANQVTIKRLENRLAESRTREILLLEQLIEKDDTILQLLAELDAPK